MKCLRAEYALGRGATESPDPNVERVDVPKASPAPHLNSSSSIHGNKFVKFPRNDRTSDCEYTGAHTGRFFDTGNEPSDWDIFIVSPELFRIAKQEGLVWKNNTKFSKVIKRRREFTSLGLDALGMALRGNGKRAGSIMIFESLDGLRSRGTYMKFE